jgi:hypothetical protein
MSGRFKPNGLRWDRCRCDLSHTGGDYDPDNLLAMPIADKWYVVHVDGIGGEGCAMPIRAIADSWWRL